MDGPRDCQSELSQRKATIVYYCLYTDKLIYKAEIETQTENGYLGMRGGWDELEYR